jgi:uncharacterized membrane protein
MGLVFLGSAFTRTPIVTWFAAALPPRIRPRLDGGTLEYLRKVTVAWAIYFILKAALFLYLALRVDLGRLVILRTVIGGGTLLLMFGAELGYRKWIRRVPI